MELASGRRSQRLVGYRIAVGVATTILLLAVIYAPAMPAPWYLDSHTGIAGNTSIRTLWPLSVPLTPPAQSTVDRRPLLNLSFALNHAITGSSPAAIRWTNVAFHGLAVLAVVVLAWTAFRRPTMPASLRSRAEALAWALGLLWAAHPLATHAVSYAVQRAESLAALLVLTSLLCFTRAISADGRSSGRAWGWIAAAWLSAAGAVLTKEIGAVTPMLALLLDRAVFATSCRELWRRRGRLHLVLWTIPALAIAWVTFSGSVYRAAINDVDSWTYLRTQFWYVPIYLKLVVWPHPLVIDRGEAMLPWSWALAWRGAMLVAAGIGAAALFLRRPRWGLLGMWIVVALAPSSSVIPLGTQAAAEYRMYLATPAALAIVVLLIDTALRRAATPRLAAGLGVTLAVTAIAALAMRTHEVNTRYQDEVAMWSHAVATSPEAGRPLNL